VYGGLATSSVQVASQTATGQPVQVVPLGDGQPQRAGQRLDHLGRRVGGAALLQPHHVVDRDPGQLREFLAAQPGRPPAAAGRQPGIAGRDPVPPAVDRLP
jgi:hypothetical protein